MRCHICPKCATLHSETRDFSRIATRLSAKITDVLPNPCPILGNFLKKFARKISRKSRFARLLEHFLIFLMWNLHILWSDFWKMREITCFHIFCENDGQYVCLAGLAQPYVRDSLALMANPWPFISSSSAFGTRFLLILEEMTQLKLVWLANPWLIFNIF